jgi:DNA-binding transcriptional LysR family regulator
VRLTLRQLQIFGAVAQTGTTTAAAANLALSQSATSAALNELERVLDVRLFDRVGRRLLLNESGRALLPSARALLDGAKSVEDGFRLGRGGAPVDLRIAASTTIGNYVLPPLLANFRSAAPEARLHLRIGNTLEVVTAVENFEADLGLIEGPCHAADLRVLPWLDDELTLVAAPTHPLALAAAQGRLPLKDLRTAEWLLREPGSGTREAVEQALIPHLLHLRTEMTLGSSEAIKNAVALGLGVSCLSKSVVQDFLDAGRLVVLRSTLPRLSRRFSIVHHQQKILSNALTLFTASLQQRGLPSAAER